MMRHFPFFIAGRSLAKSVLVWPDAGTCDDCRREFGDSSNLRFGYPFTNCTHCSPRYTIIEDTPYDRASTTMSSFTMCSLCEAEYRTQGIVVSLSAKRLLCLRAIACAAAARFLPSELGR